MSISFKQLVSTIEGFRADLLKVKLFLVSLEKRIHELEHPKAIVETPKVEALDAP